MLNTNKKFFDKKNIIKNQDGNNLFKLTMNKSEQSRNELNEENVFKEREGMYSMSYEPEDEYTQLLKPFENTEFDIGYQIHQRAFPYQFKGDILSELVQLSQPSSYFCSQLELIPIHEQRQLILFNDTYKLKQECIVYFERESTEEEDNDFEEQSTKENSNQMKNHQEEI